MERQKIFWVVLSVSVFVVIVLVVGVLLLRQHPASAAATPTVSTLSGGGTQVYEYQKEPTGATPSGTAAPNTAQPGQKPADQTLHFYIGEGNGPAGQTPPAQGTTSAPAAAENATSAEPSAPSAPARTAKQTVATAPRAPAARATVQRPAKKTNQFWIQTGSYKSQTKAEDLVTVLAGKGLTGRVFTTTANSETYFRVRVGPYASKAEAEKFLGIVKQLQGFETSFIAMVPARGPLN